MARTPTNPNRPTLDDLRNELSAGRWLDVFATFPELTDALSTVGTTQHHPCPVHGGVNNDAFRLHNDAATTGGSVCNTCGSAHDGFATICWLRQCGFNDAVKMVAQALGYEGVSSHNQRRSTHNQPSSTHNQRGSTQQSTQPPSEVPPAEIQKQRAKLAQRWGEAIPDTGRIGAYLRSRGLSGNVPPSLKLCQSLPYYEQATDGSGGLNLLANFPGMVAQVQGPALGLVGLHRTYLHPNGEPGKAPVPQPKKLTPPIYPRATTGAAIRLFPAGRILAVAEGIETALAVNEATGTPAWSTISAGGMASLEIPSIVERLEIWADSGEAGEKSANELAQRAASMGLEVLVIVPPMDKDWLDVYVESHIRRVDGLIDVQPGQEKLRAARDRARPFERPEGMLPEIQIHTKEHLVVDEAVQALSNDPTIFQRGGTLVHVVRDVSKVRIDADSANQKNRPDIIRDTNSPQIATLPKSRLRERMTAVADWKKYLQSIEEWIPAHPPDWAISAIQDRGEWCGIRPIEGVVETPVLRPDGSIVNTPGYDQITGLLYEPQQEFPPVPENPTVEEITAARDMLLHIVVDFPFKSDVHRSAWLASLFTPLARYAFSGPAPLFLSDANVAGAGKTLLCDIVGWLITGRDLPRMAYSNSEEEMRKRITSLAISGDHIVLIDNIATSFGCPSLDAVLTGTYWSDRLLGESKSITVQMQATWYASGNNVVMKSDITRRTLHIRLESPEERPEERENFTHPDIKVWVLANRGPLVSAALTILRAYVLAGRPDQNIKPWGSFLGWNNVVRNALVWLGLPDPGETREELKAQADSKFDALQQLIAGWEALDPHGIGKTIAEAVKELRHVPSEYAIDELEPLRDAISELCPTNNGKLASNRSIGMVLKNLRGRVIGGKCMQSHRNRSNTTTWYVKEVTDGTTGTKDLSQINNMFDGDFAGTAGTKIPSQTNNPDFGTIGTKNLTQSEPPAGTEGTKGTDLLCRAKDKAYVHVCTDELLKTCRDVDSSNSPFSSSSDNLSEDV